MTSKIRLQVQQQTNQSEKVSHNDSDLLSALLHSLQRLVKIGIYYPSGHALLDRATDQFCSNLKRVAGDTQVVEFTVEDSSIFLQGIELDPSNSFNSELRDTFAKLAISRLEINREIAPDEVHRFIRSLLVFRTKVNTAKSFGKLKLEGLPSTVRASQTEYLSSVAPSKEYSTHTDGSRESLNALLTRLKASGLDGEQLQQCKLLLETATSHLVKSKQQGTIPLTTWGDVEKLLLRLIKSDDITLSHKEKKELNQDLHQLNRVLYSLGESGSEKRTDKSVELLSSLIKKSSGIPETAAKKKQEAGRVTQFSANQFERFIFQNSVKTEPGAAFQKSSRAETISILLQLCLEQLSVGQEVKIQLHFREVLTTALNEQEWTVLVSGVRQLLTTLSSETLYTPMVMILKPLRQASLNSALIFLERLGQGCIADELKKLLPYLVNELLLAGSEEQQQTFSELCKMVLFVSAADLLKQLPVLEQLEAVSKREISEDLFSGLDKEFYPVFAPLLVSPVGSIMAERLLSHLKDDRSEWIIEALRPLLDINTLLHRKFLYQCMIAGFPEQPNESLSELFQLIAREELPKLPAETRKNPQLMATIAAIPQFRSDELEDILKNIINTRRLILFPEWPPYCRQAAREALQSIQKNNKIRKVIR